MKTLDHTLIEIVESRWETLTEKDLAIVQSKIWDVLGPMCSGLRTSTEKATVNEKSEEKEEPVSLEDMIWLIKKFVMLLGQANNRVAYFWRLNISSISLNSKLLSTNITEPFGRQFPKQVIDNTKA